MKTLKLDDQLGLLGWAVSTAHYASELREQVAGLVRELVSEEFSGEFLEFMNKIPIEGDYSKEMLMACSNTLIEFCHRVGTIEEFHVLMATEYYIFQEFCRLGDVTAEPYEQHIKDMSPKLARDYLATKASEMSLGSENKMSDLLLRALMASKMDEMLPKVAETFVTGEFFDGGYRDKELLFTGKDVQLVSPTKVEAKETEDEWAELLQETE